jgi:hypothetical protein
VPGRRYLEDLLAAVLEATRAGQSLEDMKAISCSTNIRIGAQYEDWGPTNIE